MQNLCFPEQIRSAERSVVGVALDIQPLGLQRKFYLTCLLCTKSCPDVAYFLEIIGPTHTAYEASKVIMTSHRI